MLLVNHHHHHHHHPVRISRITYVEEITNSDLQKNLNIKPTRQKQKVFMGVTRNHKMETQQEQYTYLLIMRQQR